MRLPPAIRNAIRLIFEQPNAAVTEAVSTQTGYREPELDVKFIEALQGFQRPLAVRDWLVRVDAIRIGSYQVHIKKEAGDIALIAHYYRGGKLRKKKMVILQAKKLYARPMHRSDAGTVFNYDSASRYAAFNSSQQAEIQSFAATFGVPVVYAFYNPCKLPHVVQPPGVSEATRYLDELLGSHVFDGTRPRDVQHELSSSEPNRVGCRIVPAETVHSQIEELPTSDLSFKVLMGISGFTKGKHRGGWRLEDFVADVFLVCRIGAEVQDSLGSVAQLAARLDEIGNRSLSAVVIVTLEAPNGHSYE